MSIVTLMEIGLDSGTFRLGPEDLEFPASAPEFYNGYIASSGSLKDSFADLFTGSESLKTLSFALKNNLSEIDDIEESEDFRGKEITIKRVDLDTDTVLKTNTLVLDAPSSDLSKSSFSAERQPLDIWQENFPFKKINLDDFSEIPNGSDALGQTINIAIGYTFDIRCWYIKRDVGSNAYDYLIGHGTLGAATEVRDADGVVIPSGEYTFYDGSQGSPFPGYAFLRFSSEQRNHQGNLDQIFVDVEGIEISGTTERNSVKVLEEFLTNTTWGLGQTVNAANFTAEAAIADTLNLKCDGLMYGENKMAEDWKEHILFACLMGSLDLKENGYELTIPQYQSSASAEFDSNTLRTVKKNRQSSDQFMREVIANYYLSLKDKKYQKNFKQEIAVDFGVSKDYNLDMVFDDETADRIAQLLIKRAEYQDKKRTYEADDDIASLFKGDRVDIDGDEFEIISTDKKLIPNVMTVAEYTEDIFDYVAETPQGDPPDLPSAEPPDDVTGLTITPQFELQDNGDILSWFDVAFTAPDSNFLQAMVSVKRNGSSVWQDMGPSDDEKFKLTGVTAGFAYDVRLISVNSAGLKSSGVVDLNNLAAGDTTAPSTPSGFSADDDVTRTKLDWNDNTEKDFDHYNVYRNSSKIAETKSSLFFDNPPAYNTNYGYQVSAVDRSGNESTKTSSDNAKKIPVDGADIDIKTGQITITEGAGITFNGRCKIDVSSLDFRMLPTTHDAYDFYIGGANKWKAIRAYAQGAVDIQSFGSSVAITAANDVNIFASDAVYLRNLRLGFFNGSIASKQTVNITATGGAPLLYNQTWGNQVEASLASIYSALNAYDFVN